MKRSLWLVAFLQSSSDEASGFVSIIPITCHHFRIRSCSDSELHDSLFDDIFESSSSNSNEHDVLLPPKNYNEDAAPFSELESEQDRARRMEMVRELQKVYYKDHPDSSTSTTTAAAAAATESSQSSSSSTTPIQPTTTTSPSSSSNALSYGEYVLRNLPTITSYDGIKTADNTAILPGYQFVWEYTQPSTLSYVPFYFIW